MRRNVDENSAHGGPAPMSEEAGTRNGSGSAPLLVIGAQRPVREVVADATSVDARANTIGRSQHGRVTRAQLAAAGVSASSTQRRLRAGTWTAHRGGLIDLGTHESTWQQEVVSALLAAGACHGRAWASHLTAAHLHGFLDVVRPSEVELTVPRTRRPGQWHGRIHRVRDLPSSELTVIDGIPATSAARTLLDLGASRSVQELEPVVWDAARRWPSLTRELGSCAVRAPRHRGRSTVHQLLQGLHPQIADVESPLEVHGLLALRDPRLPHPVVQYVVRDHHGRFLGRVDAAWPAARVAVEFDGAAYHETTTGRVRARERRERLRRAGWIVVVVTARQLAGPRLRELTDQLHRLIVSG